MPVALIGTFDTKGAEFAYVRGLLNTQGVQTLTIDAGAVGAPLFSPDVTRD